MRWQISWKEGGKISNLSPKAQNFLIVVWIANNINMLNSIGAPILLLAPTKMAWQRRAVGRLNWLNTTKDFSGKIALSKPSPPAWSPSPWSSGQLRDRPGFHIGAELYSTFKKENGKDEWPHRALNFELHCALWPPKYTLRKVLLWIERQNTKVICW